MRNKKEILGIYEEVRNLYIDETRDILNDLFQGASAQQPTEVFPPHEGSTFDSRQAETGFLKHDCAIITAFRATRTKKDNERKNLQLEKDMKRLKLKYLCVDGCFREAKETEASHEDSFFVYDDNSHNSRAFFANLYRLSEKYEQDSFLFKSAGMNRTAYLVSTNADSRSADGNVKLAGRLYLDLPPVGPYTELDQGRITFLIEPPAVVAKQDSADSNT